MHIIYSYHILYAYDIICIIRSRIISYHTRSRTRYHQYHTIIYLFYFLDFNHHIFYIKIQIFIKYFFYPFKLHTIKVLSQKKTGFHILSCFFLSFLFLFLPFSSPCFACFHLFIIRFII